MSAWYFDHNVSQPLADLLCGTGHTVITARDLHLEVAGDERHLVVAAERRTILCTHNVKDFRLLHDAWLLWSRTWNVQPIHAGIVIFPDAWPDARAAQELGSLIAQGFAFVNTCYEWRPRIGWQLRLPRPI